MHSSPRKTGITCPETASVQGFYHFLPGKIGFCKDFDCNFPTPYTPFSEGKCPFFYA